MSDSAPPPMPLAVLISGSGTNLQAILDATATGQIPARVAAVISDRPEAYGLQRARAAGVPAETLPAEGFADRDSYDLALGELISRYHPGLVLLAGFMRILSPGLVQRFRGRMLNIHPSLLPKYRGLDTYRRVLEAGDAEHGTSVHFVTDQLDAGPVVLQAKVSVHPADDEAGLSARVQAREHKIYPLVIGWFAAGRLRCRNDTPWLDGEPLAEPIVVAADQEPEE